MLPYVLDELPKKDFVSLPATHVRIDALYDTAMQWMDEEQEARCVALLEPWFAGDGALPGRLEPLFDALMDAYLALGKTHQRERLIEQALARGDRVMQCVALQRRAVMLADRGAHQEAIAAFAQAQRLDPDNVSLSHLEVTLLIGAGRLEQARERARFWLARARRGAIDLPPELVQLLESAAIDPSAAVMDVVERHNPAVAKLRELLAAAPAPALHYRLDRFDDGTAALRAEPRLTQAEERWRDAFAQAKPMLTTLMAADTDEAFDDPEPWLDLLAREPILWSSFDVLDDLAMGVAAHRLLGAEHTVIVPLLDRAIALLRLALGTEAPPQLPWGFMDHRPALRCVAARIDAAQAADDRDTAIALAEWLVLQLNPHDNHGMRFELSRMYLQAGTPEKLIALAEQYPDDTADMTLNRVLALYMLGRSGEALIALQTAADKHPKVVSMLVAAKARQPRINPGFVTLGGDDEAWLYREAHIDLWRDAGALAWATQAYKAVRPRSSR
jgi:tetratricopeptide (TPR) repeat protein